MIFPTLRAVACMLFIGIFVVDAPQCGTQRRDYAQFALAYLSAEQPDRALLEIRRALRQHGDDSTLHLIAAFAYLSQEQAPRALTSLGKGLQVAPDDLRLHQTLRDVCRQFSAFHLAQPILEQLLDRHPGNGHLETSLGWIYAAQEEDEKAVELLVSAIADKNSDLFAHFHLSRIYQRQERFGEAARILQEALDRVPHDQRLLLALGENYLLQGMAREATAVFGRAQMQSKTPGVTTAHIAMMYYERGLWRQAIEYYERALQLGNDDSAVLNNLAWTYAAEGIYLERALELATRAVKIAPDNVVYLDTYAELFYQKGRPARAVAIMRRALELALVDDGERYAYLHEQLEKFQQALQSLPETANTAPGNGWQQ